MAREPYDDGFEDGIEAAIKYIEENDLDIENWRLDEIRGLKTTKTKWFFWRSDSDSFADGIEAAARRVENYHRSEVFVTLAAAIRDLKPQNSRNAGC